jgi:hypothetical protein
MGEELLEAGAGRARSGRAAVTGYDESYAVYAARYGASARTIKRWVKIGRDRDDALPLDQPGEMRAWWSRCMTLRCPPGIVQAAVDVAREPKEAKETDIRPLMLESEERGLAGALARLEQMEVRLAERADQPGQADPWLRTISRMTALATKLRQELQAQGELVPKREVAAELKTFHGQIVSVLKSMLTESQVREVFELLNQEVFS